MNELLEKLAEIKKAEDKKKRKKKKFFEIRKEKPLQYYSGWSPKSKGEVEEIEKITFEQLKRLKSKEKKSLEEKKS